ncbi:hypothetical protein Vafri_16291 [Volvox africanus]|uniref:Uncharacterized protein n=1 Tax=Volvox africanus TaxID=51714 RepID=A0A8J4BHS8_9CHLO|nr:hypothetical protein Vafri_16291 [Volvox africanus]
MTSPEADTARAVARGVCASVHPGSPPDSGVGAGAGGKQAPITGEDVKLLGAGWTLAVSIEDPASVLAPNEGVATVAAVEEELVRAAALVTVTGAAPESCSEAMVDGEAAADGSVGPADIKTIEGESAEADINPARDGELGSNAKPAN